MRKFGKESTASQEGATRESGKGWLQNHSALAVGIVVIIALLLRTVFAYGYSAAGDFALSGGASAQYHLHVVESILSGSAIFGADAAVNYPAGGLNVYPPLYDYIAAAVGAGAGASLSLAVLAPIFGALTCIPVYLVGKELYGFKAGFLACVLFALFALPISSTVFSNGTSMAFVAFLIAFFIYAMIKVVRSVQDDVFDLKNILIAGLILGLIALSWNGFRTVFALLMVVMIIQILIDRFNSKDFSVPLRTYSVVMLIGLVLGAVYYIPAGLWDAVFSGIAILTILVIAFGFIFKALESKPWIFVIPGLIVAFAVIVIALYLVSPSLGSAILGGNSIYLNSIAASLASNLVSISKMSSYYGWVTMWLPIILGIVEFYRYARKDRSHMQLFKAMFFIVLWMCAWTSTYNAAVLGIVFAVGSGALIVMVLSKVDLREWCANIKAAGFPGCFRKLIKPAPFITAFVLAFLIIVPNVSFAVDAGIPTNDDNQYYFTGNTQFTIATGDDYPYSYVWDDMNKLDITKNDAVVTWIDYANDPASQLGLPSVNDMNGTGASAVAQIYLAKGEAGATAASIVRIMMSANVDVSSAFSGFSVYQTVVKYINNPDLAKKVVLSDPDTYGSLRSDITGENAIYLASVEAITSTVSTGDIYGIYDNICEITKQKIGFFVLDGSMLTTYYSDGSILPEIGYYAGYTADKYGAISQFYNYPYVSYGYYYAHATDALYDTFLWKALVGISPSDAGYASSFEYLYALSASTGDVKSMAGAGLAGYKIVSWHVLYNADSTITDSKDKGWKYMGIEDAVALQEKDGGIINYLSSVIAYEYVGVNNNTVSGIVVDEAGNGVAGLTVAVESFDEKFNKFVTYSETTTDLDGKYSALVPQSGSYTITLKNGSVKIESASKNLSGKIASAEFTADVALNDAIAFGDYKLVMKNNGNEYQVQSENGVFSSDDVVDKLGVPAVLIPGEYSYTLYDSAASKVASGTISLYAGDNAGITFTPTTYTITATVKDMFSQSVSGGYFVALNVSTGDVFSAPVQNGTAVVTVAAGTYTVKLVDGYATLYSSTVAATSSNKTVTITAYDANTVSVSGVPNVSVVAYNDAFSSTVFAGSVDIPTSAGVTAQKVTFYAIDGTNVYYGVYTGGSSVTLATSYAYEVSGLIGASGKVSYILNDNGAVFNAVADSAGQFSMLVPAGVYTVYATNGSSSAYVGTTTVSADATGLSYTLESARKITATYSYESGTSSSTVNLPFAKAEATFTLDGKSYGLVSATNTSGVATFYVPEKATGIKVAVNDGAISNSAFAYSELSAVVEDGTGSASKTFNIPKDGINTNTISAPYTMTLTAYGSSDSFEFVNSGAVAVGQYTAKIDPSTGYYFSGTIYVYPGKTTFSGLNPTKVFVTEIVSGAADEITITGDKTYSNYKDDLYYFETDCEYTVKSSNVINGTLKYGLINSSVSKIDMTSTALKMTVKGNIGVVASGTVDVQYGNVTITADVDNGAFSVDMPDDVTSAKFTAKATKTVSNQTYSFSGSIDAKALANGSIVNVPVYSGLVYDDESDLVANILTADFSNGVGKVGLSITNNTDSKKTYVITSGYAWTVETSRVTVAAGATSAVAVTGIYDKTVGIGTDGVSVVISDVNGTTSKTLRVIAGTTSGASDITMFTAKTCNNLDKLAGSQYMYALTFKNAGEAANVAIKVNSVSGYFLSLVNSDGSLVAAVGENMIVAANSETVIYVAVMKEGGQMTTVPGLEVSVSGVDGGNASLTPSTINLNVDSMTVSGDGAVDERAGVPAGLWFIIALCILLIILIFWMGSKRGVFTRR